MSNPSIDNLPEIEAEFIKAKRESLNISRFDLAKNFVLQKVNLSKLKMVKKISFIVTTIKIKLPEKLLLN